MAGIYQSVTELIGRTPLLEVKNLEKELNLQARVLVKLEYFNPAGSVKDRAALQMITEAEENGTLKPGSAIIEPTSGNTGIGLASIAASRGYRAIFVMPETMSIERRKLLKGYGAEIVLTEGAKGMKGAIEKDVEDHAPVFRGSPAGHADDGFIHLLWLLDVQMRASEKGKVTKAGPRLLINRTNSQISRNYQGAFFHRAVGERILGRFRVKVAFIDQISRQALHRNPTDSCLRIRICPKSDIACPVIEG